MTQQLKDQARQVEQRLLEGTHCTDVPGTIVALITALEAAEKDAARYRWLTTDHDDANERDAVESISVRLRWVGKGAADTAIDAVMHHYAAIAQGSKTP